jgi:glycosyltransferase involved in cell wall biosynthesis
VLEAMALSLPVVATTAGGLSTFLRDGDDALLCAPGSPAALADAFAHLRSLTELRSGWVRLPAARVERECSFALRMRRVFAVYDRLS